MGNRIALLVSVVLAGLASLATTSVSAAPAADECLAKPTGVAPAGKHWYYRTNRAIQRKCWYLGDAGEKIVTVEPRKQPVASTPPVDAGRQGDARAELLDGAFIEQPSVSMPPVPSAAPGLEEASRAPDDTNRGNWTIASRWPESSDAFAASGAPAVAAPEPVSQSAQPSSVAAAVVEEQAPAVVDNGGSVDFGQILSALILLVVVGGTITLFIRHDSASRDRLMRERTRRHDEMPWVRSTAPRSASVARPRVRDREDMIREIEQLLATKREGQASPAGRLRTTLDVVAAG